MTIDWTTYEAVLFDLDGVLTATAALHARAWKRMFDDFLAARASRSGAAFAPFELPGDYALHVDGLPRYDGVRGFLSARRIALPDGAPADPPNRETVCGLGNRKQRLFSELLASEGVDAYPGSVAVVRHVRAAGVRTGVVSSSRTCAAILAAAGLSELFGVRIDGVVAAERGLAGKPAPDTFLHAARELGAEPSRSAVVEDAIAGVEAGRAGGFALVVAIDRTGNAAALAEAGADLVVEDLGDTLRNETAVPGPGPGPGAAGGKAR